MGLLVAGALFFYFNFAMGDTILGNVIALFISAVSSLGALIVAATGLSASRSRNVILALSATLLVAIVVLVVTDNVAMGYGP